MYSNTVTAFTLLKKILIYTCFILIIILSSLPLTFLYIWKSIVTQWVKIFHKDLSPLTFIDYVTITALDPEIGNAKSNIFNCTGGIYCKLKGKVNGREFFKAFEKNVIQIDYSKEIPPNHEHIRFHQSISRFGGYWFFKTFRNQLKYEDHVTCITLGDNISYEEEICNWLKIRYDIKKCPLWGILLIYRKESDDTIFALKLHHVLADGITCTHIVELLTNTRSKYPVQDNQETKWESFKILSRAAFRYFEYLTETILTVPCSPIHQLKEGDDLFLTQVSLPLSLIKKIRQNKNVRFQAVMLDIILNYINTVINDAIDKENIPDKICAWASLPWPNHPQKELCNHFTAGQLAFKIENKNNLRQDNITEINQIFQDFHDQYCDRAAYHFFKPMSLLPVNLLQAFNKRVQGKITAVFAHLMCYGKYTKVFDIECCDINCYLVPAQQKLLTFVGFTISNEIKMTIIGPKSLFSSQQQADQFLKENIQNYLAKLTENANVFE